jgi:hypothetical protein
MALTVTAARNGIEVHSNKVTRTWNAALTTYTSGGEPLTAKQLGLTSLDFLEIEPQSLGGLSLRYNPTTALLQAYIPNAVPAAVPTEVTAGTDLSWLTGLQLRAHGV